MLVIRRRAGESFLIGENVEIEILEVGGTQVKLGIRAPKEISVLRKEVQLAGHQNRAASQAVSHEALAALVGKLQRP